MTRFWPWAENRGDKLKRIVASYRTALSEMAPGSCHLVDARMVEFGEAWVCENPVDVDRLVTVQEAASEFGMFAHSMAFWARQRPDRIPVRGTRAGKNLYRLGDLIRYDALRE